MHVQERDGLDLGLDGHAVTAGGGGVGPVAGEVLGLRRDWDVSRRGPEEGYEPPPLLLRVLMPLRRWSRRGFRAGERGGTGGGLAMEG
jgi:hypothetical protein